MTPETPRMTDAELAAHDAQRDAWLAIPADIRDNLAAFGTVPPGMDDADRAAWIARRGEEQFHCP